MVEGQADLGLDFVYGIAIGRLKWEVPYGVLCDGPILLDLRGTFCTTTIRLAMAYGVECWLSMGPR